ncbi:Cpr [Symbiodinium sp. CCMP2456]|nr:Cpr [Symbiodinium sp. CCMP2456]
MGDDTGSPGSSASAHRGTLASCKLWLKGRCLGVSKKFGLLCFVCVCTCVCRFWGQTKTTETLVKCPVSTPSILVKDLRVITKKESNLRKTRKKRGILLAAAGKKRPFKKSKIAVPAPSCYESWPVFRPFDLFQAIVQAGLISELNHPVQSWSDNEKATAYPISIYGDEGQSKRSKNMLIIDWAPLASTKEPMYGKFPYVVIKSDRFHYAGDRNITLEHLQADLVNSLNHCADRGNGLGATLHVVTGKADWKFRKEWLQQSRFYGKIGHGTHGICARCFAAKHDWLDVEEKFNNPADIARAQETAVGPNIPFRELSGWSCNMEVPDVLHCVYLGSGRDLVGSIAMEMAERRQDLTGSTYDERLDCLRRDIQAWCGKHNIRPSTIDELRFLFLRQTTLESFPCLFSDSQ